MAHTGNFIDINRLPIVYHPGETLEEKLQEMNMSATEFASSISIPEDKVIAVINGECSISADMAVAFESATKIPAHMWLSLQESYDNFIARKKRRRMQQSPTLYKRTSPAIG